LSPAKGDPTFSRVLITGLRALREDHSRPQAALAP
jgi:carbonic anhydrase